MAVHPINPVVLDLTALLERWERSSPDVWGQAGMVRVACAEELKAVLQPHWQAFSAIPSAPKRS